MKHELTYGLLAALLCAAFTLEVGAQDSSFTYQGRLTDGGNPASGIYDLRFTIYDSSGGSGVIAGPLTNSPTSVSDGQFTVSLNFGAAAFNGANRWLEIQARTNGGGAFTPLTPRQPITATPYALTASKLSGTLPATQLTGTVPDSRLSGNVSLLGAGVDSAEIADGAIVNADISPSAAIADTKLATIATAGKVSDTALSANVALLNRSQTFTGTNLFASVVGINSGNPQAQLEVVTDTNVAIRATRTATLDARPAVLATSDSTAPGAFAVQGVISSTAPGGLSAAIRGENKGTGSLGVGVYGSHAGNAYGVYGTSVGGSGVRGLSATSEGVHGNSTSGQGIVGLSASGNAGRFETSSSANSNDVLQIIAPAGATNKLLTLAQGGSVKASFAADGSLNTTGTVTASNFFTLSGAPLFSGLNGAALTNLNTTNLVGTVADARLSANVALRLGGNTFTGTQTVTNGNVGIGTTTPGAPLWVEGNGDSVSGAIVGLQTTGAIDSAGVLGQSLVPGGNGVIGRADVLRTNSTGPAGGNIGVIGVSATTNGTGLYGGAEASSGTTYGVVGGVNSPQGYAGYFMGRGYFSGNVGINSLNTGSDALLVNGTARVTGGFSGNVGIGTGNPIAAIGYPPGWQGLHIRSPFNDGLGIIQGATSARLHLRADGNNTNSQDFIIANGANKIEFRWLAPNLGNGPLAMAIATNGNVGIGTINPVTRLDVAGTVSAFGYNGNGSGLTGLAAANLTGIVPDARLSGNVSLLGASVDSAEIADGSIVNADISTSATIADTKLATIATAGKVADSALSANVSTLGASIDSAEIADGTVTTNDLSASVLNSTFWKLGGNAGTTPGTHFLGTTDDQPLEFKVNGQRGLRLEYRAGGAATSVNVIGGYSANSVVSSAVGATIAGGGSDTLGTNQVMASFGTVGGGRKNTAHGESTVGGGANNTASGSAATIGGGANNTASGNKATVGGGEGNTASGSSATIPGGSFNTATDFAFAAGRQAKANHQGAFVWADSTVADFASTANNQFLIRASGGVGLGTASPSSVLDVKSASGDCEIGLLSGSAGGHRWTLQSSSGTAGGLLSSSFQIIDRTAGASRLLVATNGNVGIGTASPGSTLEVDSGNEVGAADGTGKISAGAQSGNHIAIDTDDIQKYDNATTPGTLFLNDYGGNVNIGSAGATTTIDGTFVNASDRNLKEDFQPVESATVLARLLQLPVSTWKFKGAADARRHVGPMAQDFHAAFNDLLDLKSDDKTIAPLDEAGVAFVSIQALNRKLEQKLAQKETEITELKQRLEKLEQLIAQKLNGGAL